MEDFMERMRRLALLPIAMLAVTACQADSGASATGGAGGSSSASEAATVDISNVVCVGEATTYLDWLNGDFQPDEQNPIEEPADTAGDLLETVQDRGTLIVSTDPNYAPQSFLETDGTFVGFDIDVATEIANRLGVEIAFETPEWDAITAGSWSERWDISVGSMTITTPRKEVLDFTQPYYYTPASLAVAESTGITDVTQLPFELPEGAEATTLPTDANCAEAIEAGRTEFSLWVSSETTIDGAIERGLPLVKIPPAEPIFTENLAVAFDKSGPPHDALLFEVDRIIGEMHEDGTLTEMSEEWFDADLTQAP
jgi:polar amino acid transport system substrate-binding protein